jgi:hypothetical protein
MRNTSWEWILVLVVSCILAFLLAEHGGILDPPLIVVLVAGTNITSLIIGRKTKHEEMESNSHRSFLRGSHIAPTEPSDHGVDRRPGDEEHPDIPESP